MKQTKNKANISTLHNQRLKQIPNKRFHFTPFSMIWKVLPPKEREVLERCYKHEPQAWKAKERYYFGKKTAIQFIEDNVKKFKIHNWQKVEDFFLNTSEYYLQRDHRQKDFGVRVKKLCPNLQHLYYHSSKSKDFFSGMRDYSALKRFARGICDLKTLKYLSLDLGWCGNDHYALKILASTIFRSSSSLKSVSLTNLGSNDEDIQVLAYQINRNFSRLKSLALDLHHCPEITKSGFETLAKAITNGLGSLKTLKLRFDLCIDPPEYGQNEYGEYTARVSNDSDNENDSDADRSYDGTYAECGRCNDGCKAGEKCRERILDRYKERFEEEREEIADMLRHQLAFIENLGLSYEVSY